MQTLQADKPIIIDEKSHIIIRHVFSKEICDLLANYANFKASVHSNKRNDRLKNVHREYGDPLMEMLLDKLTPLIELATGLELWPTLSFYYTYTHGTQLARHKDRSSCEIVAGLCIGADDAFKKTHGSWPLMLTDPESGLPKTIALEYGDLVIFRGNQTEHWREAFAGLWFVSAIFAYVDKNGSLAFQKYDQRKSLGKPHIGMFHWAFGCFMNKIMKTVQSCCRRL